MIGLPQKIIAVTAAVPLVPLVLLGYGCKAMLRRRRKRKRAKPLVLVLSQVIWDEVWQRPQEHARRSASEYDVIYCCPVQVHNWFYSLGERWKTSKVERHGKGELVVLSPLVFPGHFKSRIIHEINSRIVSVYVRLLLQGEPPVHALTNTPFSWPVLKQLFFLREGKRSSALQCLLYDLIDDFTAFSWAPSFGKEFERELLHAADSVITGTRQLSDSRGGAPYIPCGVDYEAFASPAAPPPGLRELPRPLIGYIGTISERLDYPLLRQVAENFPDASIVMVGPVHSVDELPRLPNIHYLGLRPHPEIPAIAQAFDAALIPFRLSPATVNLHPVKTLEYLAAGVPVISTALPEIERFYSGAVTIAQSPVEFLEGLKRVLKHPDMTQRAAGQALAKNASWQAMTETINAYLLPSLQDEAKAGAMHQSREGLPQ